MAVAHAIPDHRVPLQRQEYRTSCVNTIKYYYNVIPSTQRLKNWEFYCWQLFCLYILRLISTVPIPHSSAHCGLIIQQQQQQRKTDCKVVVINIEGRRLQELSQIALLTTEWLNSLCPQWPAETHDMLDIFCFKNLTHSKLRMWWKKTTGQ